MSFISFFILAALVLVLYLGGRVLGLRVGGKASIWLAVTLAVLAVNVLMMFKPSVLGLVGSLAFPLALGVYRGSKTREARDQSGSGSS